MNKKDDGTPNPITVLALRRRLRETLDRTVHPNERFVVLRNGVPVAILLGVELYRRLVAAPAAGG